MLDISRKPKLKWIELNWIVEHNTLTHTHKDNLNVVLWSETIWWFLFFISFYFIFDFILANHKSHWHRVQHCIINKTHILIWSISKVFGVLNNIDFNFCYSSCTPPPLLYTHKPPMENVNQRPQTVVWLAVCACALVNFMRLLYFIIKIILDT